jgi:hypothetical protein
LQDKNNQRNKQRSWASSHKSGGLVLVLASGPSACPKNARDLTFQPFVGIMGAYWSSCFLLSGGIVTGGQLEFGNLWGPREPRLMVFLRLHLQTRPVVGRSL